MATNTFIPAALEKSQEKDFPFHISFHSLQKNQSSSFEVWCGPHAV